ncbi:MAG: AEC family transporter [Planctomycetaceae bacterium]|jgi:predicted permease|nr:AEC family transporter [Planctomycetaceae bacterium]
MPQTFFHTFSISLAAILSVLCIIVLAIVLRRTGRIPPTTDHGLLRLTIDLLIPCLIIDRILNTNAFSDTQNLWLPPLLGFSLTGLGILVGLAVASVPVWATGLATQQQKRTFASCVGVLNYGYIAIPLVDVLFSDNHRTMGVLFLQYLGTEISIWTLVIFTMLGKLDSTSWRQLVNCPILALLVAIPLNLLGHSVWVPEEFHDYVVPCFGFLLWAIHQIGQAAIPISLLTVGLTMTALIRHKEIKNRWRTTLKISFWSCLIRLVVMPVIFLLLAVSLPCTVEIKRVLVIHGAMGSAIFPIVLAKHYNGNTEIAFDTIMSNTLVSIMTLPFWIAFGLKMI